MLELLRTDPARIDTLFLQKGRRSPETDELLDLCREKGVRFSLVDEASLKRLWRGRHQGVIARLYPAGFVDLEAALEKVRQAPLPLLLALDNVQDPGNAGTLARTLYAFGGSAMLIPRHNGVYLGASAAKASAGALDKLAIVKATNLGQALDICSDAGFAIYGASAEAAQDAFAWIPEFPAVLVLGNEDAGLRPSIIKRCDALLRIPFARDFNSLNVAQAGAILLGRCFAALRD